MAGAHVLNWNGEDLPTELRELPAGRYVVDAVDDAPTLTPEEDDGLRRALSSLQAGQGRTAAQVRLTGTSASSHPQDQISRTGTPKRSE